MNSFVKEYYFVAMETIFECSFLFLRKRFWLVFINSTALLKAYNMRTIPEDDRWAIATYQRKGLGARKIQWRMKTELEKDYSVSGIQYVMNRYSSTGQVADKKRVRIKTARTQASSACGEAKGRSYRASHLRYRL